MNRTATATLLLLLALAPVERVDAQRVVDFNDTAGAAFGTYDFFTDTFSGGSPYAGFNFAQGGSFGTDFLVAYGDSYALLMHSPTPFTFNSALFRSTIGTNNRICVSGYTGYVGSDPGCGDGSRASYWLEFYVSPGAYQPIVFDWVGVTTLAFDSMGGIDLADPAHSTAFIFNVDDVAITATPEPGTLALCAAGLLGLAMARKRRRSFDL